MSSPLIEIKPVAHNKIAALQPAELEIDIHLLIRSFHQHHSIHPLRLHLSEQLDQLLQSMTRIVDVLNDQYMLILKLLRFQLCLNCQLAGRLRPCVTLAPDELVSVIMFNFFDQIGEEHECSLQDTNNHQVKVALFIKNGGVVLVDFPGKSGDYVRDVLLGVEKLEGQTLVGHCCHVVMMELIIQNGGKRIQLDYRKSAGMTVAQATRENYSRLNKVQYGYSILRVSSQVSPTFI